MGAAQSFSASQDVIAPPASSPPTMQAVVADVPTESDNDLAALREGIRRLRAENQRLRAAHAALDLVERSRVSEAHVEAFVERIVANESTNIPGLPDAWERALEKKAILIALTAATEAISNMRVDNILGHRIRFVVEPMSDDEVAAAVQPRSRSMPNVHAEQAPKKRKRRRRVHHV